MTYPLDGLDGLRILVVGDAMLDRYLQGSVGRISPEAPVPVVQLSREWSAPGGAGHVAASLAGLGCRVTLVSLVGADEAADLLEQRLRDAGVAEPLLIPVAGGRTVVKTRVLAGDFHQLLRLDQDPLPGTWADGPDVLREQVHSLLSGTDALVLADYDKGSLTAPVIAALTAEARRQGRPTVIDPKKSDLRVYRGATVLTPNLLETERAVGRRLESEAVLEETARNLRQRLDLDAMLITRGPQGMTGADAGGVFHVPARVREVADVTGAGDTVVAVLAACLARGTPLRAACELAGVAAGIAVSHPGAYVVTLEELAAAAGGVPPKAVTRETARRRLDRERALGRRVVFTNGCFDLLHAGHLHSLQEARARGDVLVVGLNSDVSVRALKGPGRPVVNERHRAALLAGLACVDLVVLFDEDTPEMLIRHLEPDILVKGGDYDPDTLAGSAFVRSRGGQVVIVPRIDGLSSSGLLARAGG